MPVTQINTHGLLSSNRISWQASWPGDNWSVVRRPTFEERRASDWSSRCLLSNIRRSSTRYGLYRRENERIFNGLAKPTSFHGFHSWTISCSLDSTIAQSTINTFNSQFNLVNVNCHPIWVKLWHQLALGISRGMVEITRSFHTYCIVLRGQGSTDSIKLRLGACLC